MSYTDERRQTVPFRLMNRIRPHWRSIAIDLRFPSYDIEVMNHKDDPVFHLLDEWLRGANLEHDTRPLTWRTLITALRHANIQVEADILEKYIFVTKPAQETEALLGQYCCPAARTVCSSCFFNTVLSLDIKGGNCT